MRPSKQKILPFQLFRAERDRQQLLFELGGNAALSSNIASEPRW